MLDRPRNQYDAPTPDHFSPLKCEIIAPEGEGIPCIKLHGGKDKTSHIAQVFGDPVRRQRVDVARLYVGGISRAVKTANLFNTVGCNGMGFTHTVSR